MGLAFGLTFLGMGIGVGFIIHGFNFITIHKHYYNYKKEN